MEGDEEDPAALTGLLRVMVLRSAPPSRASRPPVARARARGAGGGTAAGAAPGLPCSPSRLNLPGLALSSCLSFAWCAAGPHLHIRGARHHRGALGHATGLGTVSCL
jgi:hypothetical protein